MNTFCVSNYNNNLDWLSKYSQPVIIYDKTWNGGFAGLDESAPIPPSRLKEKYSNYNIINSSLNGFNLYDYFTFIIDNFDRLPNVTAFIKGNIIGRHVREEYFNRVINNKTFTPIEDWELLATQNNMNTTYMMFSCDGGWLETNDSWYMTHFKIPTKFFKNYNDFLRFCYVNPVIPKYVRFPPGGNFIVPKENILKYDITFYKNLRTFISYTRVPAEAHLLERALYTIWTCNFNVSDRMKTTI